MNYAADDYDEVVARIYEAGAGRIDWREALEPLARRFDLWSLALFGVAKDSRNALFIHEGGLSGADFALDYLAVYHRIDPHIGPALALECAHSKWLHSKDRFDDAFVARDPFYQEFLLPRGGRYTSCAKLFEDDETAVLLLLQRAQGRPPLASDEVALFDRLRPHCVSAVRLHLERRGRIADDLDLACRVFSRMRQALALVDGELRLLYGNPAAQRLLARVNAFSERNGRLVCRNRDDDARLRAAVRRLADATAAGAVETPSAVVRVTGSGFTHPVMVLAAGLPPAGQSTDAPVVAHEPVVAHGPVAVQAPAPGQARVMLLLHETSRRRQIDPAVIGEVFQLTPAEAHVATGLAEGSSIEEIAAARGVTLETVRAQIRSVYGKTDVRSRADLVRMLLEMPSFDQAGAPAGRSR